MRVLAAACLAVLAILLVAPFAATAHTGLDSSDPADGSVVEGPLDEVVLDFTGTPTAIDDGIAVADASGTTYLPVEVTQDGLRIAARFDPPLGEGSYALSWVVRSDDTHTIDGAISFAVTVPATTVVTSTTAAPATTAGEPGTETTVAEPAATTPQTTAAPAAVTTGEAPPDEAESSDSFAVVPVAPPTLPGAAGDVEEGEMVARIGRVVFIPSAVLAVGVLVFTATAFVGRRTELDTLRRLVRWLGVGVAVGATIEVVGLRSTFGSLGDVASEGPGRAALVRILAGVLIAAGLGVGARPARSLSAAVTTDVAVGADESVVAAGRPRPSDAVAWIGAAILVVSFAFDGHTVSEGPRWVHALASVAHVVAVSVWAGGLVALAVVFWRRRRDQVQTRAVRMVVRFSVSAMWSLAIAGAAGVLMAWFIQDDLGSYPSTEWGRLMLAKLALVAVAVVLGGYNHFRLRPALEANPDDTEVTDRVWTTVTVEGAVLVAAALVTAVLVGASTL